MNIDSFSIKKDVLIYLNVGPLAVFFWPLPRDAFNKKTALVSKSKKEFFVQNSELHGLEKV